MARIRTIKPEIVISESLGRVTRDARLLFILLITAADDEGRLRGNPALLAGQLFPYDEDSREFVEPSLKSLEREKMIVRYVVDGNSYIQIVNFSFHQKIDRPSTSKLPPPPDFEPKQPPFDEDSTKPRRVLDEDSSLDQGSRIKDQGREGIKEQGEDWKGKDARDAASITDQSAPPAESATQPKATNGNSLSGRRGNLREFAGRNGRTPPPVDPDDIEATRQELERQKARLRGEA